MSRKKISVKLISVLWLLFTVSYLLGVTVSPALAQSPDYDRINEIAKKLNCPTCAGINLADCRTLTCEQWRAQIGDLVAQGYTDQEVLDYFVNRYGPQVLQEPPRSGSTLILWVLPILAILAGVGLLVYVIRTWTRGRRLTTDTGVELSAPSMPISDAVNVPDDYLEQVEKDLERGE